MECQPDDWICHALIKVGLEDFAAETARWLIRGPLKIALLVVLAIVGARLGGRLVHRTVMSLAGRSPLRELSPRAERRATTLAGVAVSSLRVAVWTVTALLVADELGFDLAPLVAGASLVGIALGFGAQSLVKDFLGGFFILVEDQYGVGDQITVDDVTGKVEEVNLRVTAVRANDGMLWIVPNGEIRVVGNAAKDWARAVVDVAVPNGADLARAIVLMNEEVEGLAQAPEWAGTFVEKPEVLGVESLGADCTIVRVQAKTAPSDRLRVARELRARIGGRLQREGIVTRQELASPDGARQTLAADQPPAPT